jgi:hypothetical protein
VSYPKQRASRGLYAERRSGERIVYANLPHRTASGVTRHDRQYCGSGVITGSTYTGPFGLACFDGVVGLRGLVDVLGASGLGCRLCMLDSNDFSLASGGIYAVVRSVGFCGMVWGVGKEKRQVSDL